MPGPPDIRRLLTRAGKLLTAPEQVKGNAVHLDAALITASTVAEEFLVVFPANRFPFSPRLVILGIRSIYTYSVGRCGTGDSP